MCGIAGCFGRSDPALVDAMLRRLAHRGPDDQFLVAGAAFSLGSRRLAIIDPQGGRQPLSNERGTVWAVQNGELYNLPELGPELEARGHRFHTRSDTELIPHLYEEHGDGFPVPLRGMFAIAVWDDERQRGLLARDPTGKKPLYYMERDGALHFASEIKSLLLVPGFDRRLDPVAVHHFLSYKHVPEPETVFQGIRSLGPGRTLSWSAESGVRVRRYWAPRFVPDPEWERMDEEEAAERVADSLREAVRRRLLSDVPIGFYLSGGIDSSLSTAMAATLSPGRIETFTLTYDESSTTPGKEEDRRWARAVAERYGTRHREERLSAVDFAEELPRVLRCFDQPFSGVVSPYFLARLISRHVKVALSGDGADELFGSYLSHRIAPAVAAWLDRGERAWDEPWLAANRALVERIADPDPAVWRARLFVLGEAEKRALYTPEFSEQVGEASSEEHLRGYFEGATARDPLNAVLEAEFRGIFPDQVLAFVDRLSMAHSLETRTAFMDVDFVELAASIPGRLKIRDGDCKYLLKKAAAPWLPEGLIRRPKEGFVMPVNQWLTSSLASFTERVLSRDRLSASGMLRPERAEDLVQRFRAGDASLANKVLSLVSLQLWWEDYLGDARSF